VTKTKSPTRMADVLLALGSDNADNVYAAFLADSWRARDYGFLVSAVKDSNLHIGAKAVLCQLIHGNLKRISNRPVSAETELKDMQRALLVLDKEGGGCLRKVAVSDAAAELKCGKRTIEKALSEWEAGLKTATPEQLQWLRGIATK